MLYFSLTWRWLIFVVIAMEAPWLWQMFIGMPSSKLVGMLAMAGWGLGLAILQLGVAMWLLERWLDACRGLDKTRGSVVS